MISIWLLLWLLFLHWIGDFFCQSDWMATNKSRNPLALLVHAIVYTLAVCFPFNILADPTPGVGFAFVALTFAFHSATDALTSNITSYLWRKEERHWFFVVIGFDQFLHFAQLLLTYKLLYGR